MLPVLVAVAMAGCAARRLPLPTDAGTPLPDFEPLHAQVTEACRGVRTFTAELSLSGRAGQERLRGRVIAGFERPASMRLEGVAPFGPPAFILAARDDAAILLLPRDERVVRGANAAEILDALTGVDLSPGDLQAVLTGCVTPSPDPVSGRQHEDDVVSITLVDGAVVYLRRQDGVWRPLGARRQGWEIEYGEWLGSFPRSVRLRSAGPGATVDVTAALSQLETNVVLEPAAFTVDVPPGADPLSLDELRAGGPLRGES